MAIYLFYLTAGWFSSLRARRLNQKPCSRDIPVDIGTYIIINITYIMYDLCMLSSIHNISS
jgi:hypothetical protein